jgi:thioredoxin 1
VDFHAEWCGPCKATAPALNDLAREYQGEARILALNVDHSPEIRTRFGVQAIPLFLPFKDGALAARLQGGTTRAKLAAALDGVLEAGT